MSIIKEKLTDKQLRIVQVIAGILSGAALIFSLFYAGANAGDSIVLQYLWLIVFVVVMFGRRWIERKFRLRTNLFNLVLVDTLAAGILIYLSILFFSPTMGSTLPEYLKLLIVIGPAIGVLILGVLLPIKRYFKRTEEGTLRPIRLPEPKEEDEAQEASKTENTGPMTLEQQINAMTKEIDEDEQDK